MDGSIKKHKVFGDAQSVYVLLLAEFGVKANKLQLYRPLWLPSVASVTQFSAIFCACQEGWYRPSEVPW